MARKVLGNDPFGADTPKPAAPAAKKKSAPAKAKPGPTKKGEAAKASPAKASPAKASPAKASPAKKAPAAKKAPVPVKKAAAIAEQEAASGETETLAPELTAAVEEAVAQTGADAQPEPAAPTPAVTAGEEAPTLESVVAQLNVLLEQAKDPSESRPLLDRLASRLKAMVEPERALAVEAPVAPVVHDEPFDVARELHGSDYYLRRWGQTAIRDRSEEVDDFGFDPDYARRWQPVWDLLYQRWWRVEVEGIENVPASGRVALVANHSGAIPFDGVMLATALRREHSARRPLRWLAEDFVFHFPFAGAYLNRLGAVRACQENAERLLRKDACVALFPEGVKGLSKPFRERYQLQRFGRGGHIKLAIRTGTPIVPVTIVGAEETHPVLFHSGRLSRMLGLPYVPVTPTFPLLGPLGLAGLPARWKIVFGEPIPMDAYRPEQSEDHVLVNRLNEKLREGIQSTLDQLLRARQSVFKG